MKLSDFEKIPSHKICKHLYDKEKEFIILGLCGKVGSGVSEVANILEQPFDLLYLPHYNHDSTESYDFHEYQILYTYAKENWKPFYKIRTSALITRHILTKESKEMVDLLYSINGQKVKKYEVIVENFFNCEMEIDLNRMLEKMNINVSLCHICDFLIYDEDWKNIENKKEYSDGMYKLILNDDYPSIDSDISFEYKNKDGKILISNKDLSKLLEVYSVLRQAKSGFKNQFWYYILQKYLFDFLPKKSSEFWGKVGESLRIQALQYLGNNLRITKNPYNNSEFKEDAYTYIAEDINLAIKVLRAYKLKKYENCDKLNINDIEPCNVVIDSIKNPYESMYLKQRYTNYYLIGVYTDEEQRKKRLRKVEHLTDDEINAIDIIEKNSDLKKIILNIYDSQNDNKSEPKTEIKNDDTSIFIKKIYEQMKEHKLLDSFSYISPFIFQNVPSALETADIFINNKTDNNNYLHLKKTLLRYVCLIMNPSIVLPTNVERCMQFAYTAKLNSGCISRQVGAALTDSKYHLLSIGWNQQPENQLPCAYRNLCELHNHWDVCEYSDYENDDSQFQEIISKQVRELFETDSSPFKKIGKFPCYCFKDYYNSVKDGSNQVHTRALHAEETAFLNYGHNKIDNGILFTTSSPCELCSKKAMYLGVSKIYYVQPYPGISKEHVMNIGKYDKRPELILFTGAIGFAYTKLYTSLLSRKDENEMWLGAKMNKKLLTNIENEEIKCDSEVCL